MPLPCCHIDYARYYSITLDVYYAATIAALLPLLFSLLLDAADDTLLPYAAAAIELPVTIRRRY